MRTLVWIGLLLASPSWAQESLTFDSVEIEGDRKKAAWTELGARPAWVMPTPVCLPKSFAHHRMTVLPSVVKNERLPAPPDVKGGQNGR